MCFISSLLFIFVLHRPFKKKYRRLKCPLCSLLLAICSADARLMIAMTRSSAANKNRPQKDINKTIRIHKIAIVRAKPPIQSNTSRPTARDESQRGFRHPLRHILCQLFGVTGRCLHFRPSASPSTSISHSCPPADKCESWEESIGIST